MRRIEWYNFCRIIGHVNGKAIGGLFGYSGDPRRVRFSGPVTAFHHPAVGDGETDEKWKVRTGHYRELFKWNIVFCQCVGGTHERRYLSTVE